MSARAGLPPRDATTAPPGPAAAAAAPVTLGGWRARLEAKRASARAAVQRRGLARAVLVLIDPWIVAGAALLGIGVATWIRDQDATFPTRLPFDVPVALFGAVVLAGRLGERRVHQRTAHLSVLQAASARMSRAATIEEVGRAIVEEVGDIVDYHNARVYVLEPPDQVVPIAFEGRVGAYEDVDFDVLRCRLGEGFTGWVAEHGIPLLIDDANRDPRGQTIPGTDEVDESMLVVPMRSDDAVVGVITLSKLGLRQFDGDDLQLLSILSDQAATALENARLLAKSRSLAAELRRLVDMSSALSGSLDPRQVGELMARHLAEAVGVAECAISTWDRDAERVCTTGYYPPDAPGATEDDFALTGYPATRWVLESQHHLVVDAADPGADPAEVAYLREQGFAALVMLPLVSKGRSIGLAELYADTPVELDPSLIELAGTMANEAAMALDNATLYERARQLADRDPLTGFFNHRYLQERLGEELLRASRTRSPVSLLMLDIDDFKLVNDTLGHLQGDLVLTWTADLIRSTLRASDVPARYGGDEFAVILPDADPAAARIVAERVLAAFAERSFLADARDPVPIGLSIGLATYPVDGPSPTALVAAADAALYQVKRGGGRGLAAA